MEKYLDWECGKIFSLILVLAGIQIRHWMITLSLKHCTTYFQCWLNGNFRSRLWFNCSEAKFYAMGQHTNNEQWRKNWVSCLLKLLSNYNFKLENHAIFYDFHAALLIVPMCANLVRERSLKPNILLNYLISSFQKCNFFFRSSFKQYDGF